jgi:hypothetical protein
MAKSLSCDSARAGSLQQQKKSVEKCSAGRAGAHPYRTPAEAEWGHQVGRSRGLNPHSPPIDP